MVCRHECFSTTAKQGIAHGVKPEIPFLFALMAVFFLGFAEARGQENLLEKLPLSFVENQGSLDEEVAVYVQGHDKTLFFTPQGITYALRAEKGFPKRWVLKQDFIGIGKGKRPLCRARQKTIIHRLSHKGKTPEACFGELLYPNLWPGIDESGDPRLRIVFKVLCLPSFE